MKERIGFWTIVWRTLHIWWSRCPDCNEWMYADFLDMKINKLVSVCKGCKKEWM
tara:strand:- start:182 stop:343 length:162 start_codon:yes stop_codon:yes gene_type:complete